MTYSIYEGNFERLEKKLATIKNKCSKYGCEFHYAQVGEEFRTITTEEGEKITARFIIVEAYGKAQVNDWEFVAIIEHSNPTNVIRTFRTEYEVPEGYYTAAPVCEHCNSKRKRKDTYLIRNTETGEFKQVGKSCLKDFTNGLDAAAVAQYISWFDELIKGETPSGGSWVRYYKVEEIVQLAVEAVNLYGYQKATLPGEAGYFDKDSTKGVVVDMWCGGRWAKRHLDKGFNVNREGNKEKATAVLAFVAGLENKLGYISNLKALCSKVYCEGRDLGIVVSSVACYDREMEYQARKAQREAQQAKEKQGVENEWFGTVGERVEVMEPECKLLTSWETEFGTKYLYRFTTENGYVFTWKTCKAVGNGKKLKVVGTVKAHTEFRGMKQTELTRCKVLEK